MKLILTGGFLGSGKTTAIVAACKQLLANNKRVAVITNDQGDQQVDQAFVRSAGIPAREVSNGCFCCNYSQLDAHLLSLRNDLPDFVFAESVGSCTDLIATIVKPLGIQRPEIEVFVTVFADAPYLLSLIQGRASFLEESVRYIYKKQLEEADLLILNKTDMTAPTDLKTVYQTLQSEYPGKKIQLQNSFHDADIARWIEAINGFTGNGSRTSIDIDYDEYGDGESRLAWLDKSIIIRTDQNNATRIVRSIVGTAFDLIQQHRYAIGHLKFFLETDRWTEKISFTAATTSSVVRVPEIESGEVRMLINARIQTSPGNLQQLIDRVLEKAGTIHKCTIVHGKWSVFKPGYPKPLHRIP